MSIRYRIDLSEAERGELTALPGGGQPAARKIKRAQILLAADAGINHEAITSSLCMGGSTVYRTKRGFVEGNLELPLSEAAGPGASRKLSGKERASLVNPIPIIILTIASLPSRASTATQGGGGPSTEHWPLTQKTHRSLFPARVANGDAK